MSLAVCEDSGAFSCACTSCMCAGGNVNVFRHISPLGRACDRKGRAARIGQTSVSHSGVEIPNVVNTLNINNLTFSIQFFIEKVAPFLVQSIPKTRSGAQKTDGALWLLITQGQSGSKLAPSVFWVSVGKALLKVSIFALTHVLLLLPVRRHYCVAIVRHFPF